MDEKAVWKTPPGRRHWTVRVAALLERIGRGGSGGSSCGKARGERGSALVFILMILGVLSVLGIGLTLFSSTELRIAENYENEAVALYAAESGVTEVMTRLEADPGTIVEANGAAFDMYIGDDSSNPNPYWRTKVYLTSETDLPDPEDENEIVVPTIQSLGAVARHGPMGADPGYVEVEHKWVDQDEDGVREASELVRYDPEKFPHENFETGSLVEVVTSVATHGSAQRQVRAEVTYSTEPWQPNLSALITSDGDVAMAGTSQACGHNHQIDTPEGTTHPDCEDWELCYERTLDSYQGCLYGVMTTGDAVSTEESALVMGHPAATNTDSENTFPPLHEVLGISPGDAQDILDDPDYTSAQDASEMHGVVVVNGDALGSEAFDSNEGTGLIYVDGDAEFSGSFTWKGLVYVTGDCTLSDDAWILGGLVVGGIVEGGGDDGHGDDGHDDDGHGDDGHNDEGESDDGHADDGHGDDGHDDDHKVTVCHNGVTIEIDDSALEEHLGHGDTLGPCPTGANFHVLLSVSAIQQHVGDYLGLNQDTAATKLLSWAEN